ncbi:MULTISPECIES: SyrB-like regulator [Rhizobium]|uniref:SyrB-like regulator n=2 Tax=Rhizobium TaxID=379 RepID=A0A387G708_9HYPH|nr:MULTISPECIES: SyrB-like regulator [Rhizobium]AYG63974.1 SyrB-like regulator [Rhizobium jaguaris]MDL2402913.1 SyrB-like regulator [Rhizobium mayense]
MADENNTGSITEMADTNSLAKTPAPKMQRAPRRPKAAAEATVATQVGKTGKAPRGRRKRREQTADTKSASVGTQAADIAVQDVTKDTVRERMSQQPEQTVSAPASARDEMADLIQLEEENKRLRKLLAEKLRAENAELRKRLGLD